MYDLVIFLSCSGVLTALSVRRLSLVVLITVAIMSCFHMFNAFSVTLQRRSYDGCHKTVCTSFRRKLHTSFKVTGPHLLLTQSVLEVWRHFFWSECPCSWSDFRKPHIEWKYDVLRDYFLRSSDINPPFCRRSNVNVSLVSFVKLSTQKLTLIVRRCKWCF